ncbi:hypothetical protein BTUL_0001g00730 [Botrytis tulipae]|uniref:Uncharacterized protein n=1 Tax=Botrytis tulipae TaxID=87230 RepID=A0A4Z1F6X0_9HELO|nr:hypothetical protein BTUL_0001g00730 [Botrytis tulipae]
MPEDSTGLSGFPLFLTTKKLFLEGRCVLFSGSRNLGAKFRRRIGMSNSFPPVYGSSVPMKYTYSMGYNYGLNHILMTLLKHVDKIVVGGGSSA